MPDLKQSLRDFIATSNSGKYSTEEELLSKFPELQEYDVQSLRDFVATSNSGKYGTEEEVFSKFPEFGFTSNEPLKKKEQTQLPTQGNVSGITELSSESTSSDSLKPFDKNALLNKGLKQASIVAPLESAPQNKQETIDIVNLKKPSNLSSLEAINYAAQERLKAEKEKLDLRNQIYTYQALNPETKGGGYAALESIISDPNQPEEKRLAAQKQKESVDKYFQLTEKTKAINATIDKNESIRQKALEERYGKLQNFKELASSVSLKMIAGTGSLFTTLGFYGDPETMNEDELATAKSQQKENLQKLSSYADSLITQETPKDWQKLFEGEWDANRVGYVVSQAFGQVVPTVAAGLITGGAATLGGAGLAYDESYSMFKAAGLSERQSEIAAAGLSIPLGMLEEMGVSDIVTKPVFKLLLKETTKDVISSLAKKELTEASLYNFVKTTMGQKIKEYGKDLLISGVKEPLTEMEQALLSEVAGQTAEAITGKDSNSKQTMEQYLKELGLKVSEEGFYGLVGGVGMSAVTSAVQNRANPTAYGRALELKDDALMGEFKRQLDREVKSGIITREQANTAIENVHKIQVADSKIPSTITGNEKRSQVASLLGIKESLKNEIDGKDKALIGPVEAAVADIDVKLNEIATGKEGEPTTETTAPIVKTEGVLSTPEATTTALEALPSEEKVNSTYIGDDGTVSPIMGNEKTLAELFHQAQLVPEEERTESQQSVIDAVEVSLKTPLDLESEVARLQEEFPISEAEKEMAKLNDNEEYIRTASSLEDVPVEFRDRVQESENTISGTARKSFLGIPYGKEVKVKSPKTYTYVATGRELKNSFDAAMKNEMQSESNYTISSDTGVSASDKNSMYNIREGVTDLMKRKVIDSAERAVRTLKSIFPNFDMVIHTEEGSYNGVVSREGGQLGTRGNFSVRRDSEGKIVGGRIDINLSKATSTTVAHEVAHAIFLASLGDNPRLFKSFRDNISKILREDTNKKLTEFADKYEEEEQSEEYLVELVALIEQEQENISTSTYQKIATLINKFISKITGGQIKLFENTKDTKELIDSLNAMAEIIRYGDEVAIEGVKEQKGTTSSSRSQIVDKANTVKDIDVKSIRMLSRAGKRVSKGLSVKTVNNKKEVAEAEDLSIDYVKENAPKIYTSNANIIAQYPIVEGIKKIKDVKTVEQAKEVYDIFIRQVADNLNYLIDNFNKEFRDASTLWYDGANILAQNFSEKYGVSEEQAAGIIASMSPQKDWYQNVRLAEMVMMAFKENPKMTKDMIKKQELINIEGLKPLNKRIRNAQKSYNLSKTKINKEKLDSAKKNLLEKTKKADKIVEYLESFIGKNMNSVPDEFKGYYTRLWNEVNTTKDYDILRPDGKVMGIAMNKDGVSKSKVAWGSYTEIGKAISIHMDGSQENITKTLGEMHKIRNFYNNIIDPMSKDKDVTMDTHAIAAALLMPLSGNAKQVLENFGKGTNNSSPLGIKGLYYAYAEAYNLAAEEKKLLPRQIQSITWEAVRGLFTDVFKSKAENVKAINDIWNKYVKGEININEARNEISEYAGGIKDPAWSGPVQEKSRDNVKSEDVRRGGDGTRPSPVGKSKRTVGTPTSKSQVASEVSRLEESFPTSKSQNGIEEITPVSMKAFNKGVESVQKNAEEYKKSIENNKRSNEPVPILFEKVSKMMAKAYEKIPAKSKQEDVIKSYDALFRDTINQYKFIVSKGLNVEKYEGEGEPYANSQEMLDDLKNNNNLKFLPNKGAFGQGEASDIENMALQPSGMKLKDGYELTNSEVFRVVHDYFGHGILGNQFGAIGEENATLQHLDLYSQEAVPAVIFQTRGQNSWVNFSGVNKRAEELRSKARKLKKEGKLEQSEKLFKKANEIFKFAEPKNNIFPNIFNFKRYETARRINEQEDINNRASKRDNELSGLLEKYSASSSGTRGLDKRDVRGTKRIGVLDVAVKAEYTLDETIDSDIKKAFPDFKGVQKIYEITDGAAYRTMLADALSDMRFAASVTVYSPEKFNEMRMFVTEDGSTGITINKEGFLGGAFSSSKFNLPQNLAQLMVLGIKEGATTAEAFDTILPDYYSLFGFKAVSRTAFNEEFRPMKKNGDTLVDWNYDTYKRYNNGRPDVVFFIYDGGNRNTIESRLGLFDNYSTYEKQNTKSFDKNGYDDATNVMKQEAIKRLEYDAENNVNTPTSKSQATTNSISKIIKDARSQGFSEEAIKAFLESRGLTSQEATEAMTTETTASKNTTISEENTPGYDRMMEQVNGIIEKSKSRGVSESDTLQNVIDYIQGSKVYENATDVQREKLVRDARKMFGKSEKSAPSANKILGTVSDANKITMSEAALLVKQIKDYARGAKNTKAALVRASTQLTKDIKALVGTGKITVKQAANVLRRFSSVNVFSEKSINKFVDYMTKVFADAEYANQISIASKTKKAISKISKDKSKNANLRALAKQFLELDPSLIGDIYAYNQNALELKNALDGSKMRAGDVNFAQTVNIESLSDYIKTNIDAQNQILLEEKIAEIQELMGLDASNFTEAEINALLEEDSEVKKSNEVAIKDTIKRMFDMYSTIIKETISSGIDPFTGEPRTFTQKQQDLINRFMEMNLNNLDAKQSLSAFDSLINFFQNDSTAKMEAVLSEYTGRENARQVVAKGIKSIPLSKWFNKSFGRGLSKHTYNLNILFERMFKGVKSGAFVEKMSGITNLINKKAYAQAQSNAMANQYVAEFFEQKANGEAFNTSANNAERGISAFLQRNVIGTDEEIAEDFNRRKELVEKTISDLSRGNENEKAKSEIYAKAYEKFKDAENVQEVIDATDEVNLKAIEFWQNKWSEKYDELADVSLNVYNKILERDTNYTPDRFVKISLNKDEDIDISNNDSTFHTNNGTLYKKETGVLQKATKPTAQNTKNVMDFSFDKNNANSMYDALIDMNTAAAVRQVEAFLKSDYFEKIFNADDAEILKSRINLYVKNIRKKNTYSNDDLNKLVKALNKISTIGVGQALAGPSQMIKQVGPVMLNTLVNAGAVDLKSSLEPSFLDFLKNSGYAIAVRGIESQGSIDSINKIIKEQSKGFLNKSVDKITGINEWMLKVFLARPDVFIARASWKSYYEKDLKKQGIDSKNIDYSRHQINEDAANYAQKMVDRQQNISDSDMAGNLFTDKSAANQILMKIFMPFASFRMNQAARLGSDLNVLTSPLSTVEDKKIAALSLSGFSVEMAAFKILSTYIGVFLGAFTKWLSDDDEDKEEKKKRIDNIIKGQVTSSITDVVSPLPVLDPLVQYGAAWMVNTTQDILKTKDKDRIGLYEPKAKDMAEQFGLFGIPLIRAKQLADMTRLAYDGTYTDNYGREREISKKSKNTLEKLLPMALVTTFIGPVEANSVVRNAIKFAKAGSSSTGKNSKDRDSGELTKSQLKRYFPAKYEKLYGKSSPGYKENESLKEKAKKLADKKREELDRKYGYVKPE